MGPVDAGSRLFSRRMYQVYIYVHTRIIYYSLACCSSGFNISLNGQILKETTLNEQIKKLNDQIDVQNNCNSTLYNQAQEMAHTIPQGHPSIAKVPLSGHQEL